MPRIETSRYNLIMNADLIYSAVRRLSFLFIFVISASVVAQTGNSGTIQLTNAKGKIYEADTAPPKALFNYQRSVTITGDETRSEATFINLSGELVFTETTVSRLGKISRYEWKHHQMKESGDVQIKNDRVHYTIRRADTEAEEAESRDAPENFVVGLSVVTYVQNHWDKIEAGKPVKVRVGVPDRMDDFGFVFEKQHKPDDVGKNIMRLQLRPTSFFVSLAVKPIEFVFTKDGTNLLSLKGMSPLKVKKNGKWTDLVAETLFTY